MSRHTDACECLDCWPRPGRHSPGPQEVDQIAEQLRMLAGNYMLDENPDWVSVLRLADRLDSLRREDPQEGMSAVLAVLTGVRDGQLAPSALNEAIEWLSIRRLADEKEPLCASKEGRDDEG